MPVYRDIKARCRKVPTSLVLLLHRGYKVAFPAALLFAFLLIFVSIPAWAKELPSFKEVKDSHRRSDALFLDRHGETIQELRMDKKGRRLDWTELDKVSPAMKRAVLQSEDRDFYEHSGVDWKAVGAALIDRLFGRKKRGASTISMQLATILEGEQPQRGRKTIGQKWDQMMASRHLEKLWKKDEILETYLNLVSFRGELQGIAATSRGMFDKEPSGLDDNESFVLSALIRAPNASPAEVGRRAALLARSLSVKADMEGVKRFAVDTLSRTYRIRPTMDLAPHAALRLTADPGSPLKWKGDSPRRITTTLDLHTQRFALESLRQHLDALEGRNVGEGAVLVVANATGEVLAYVGSTGSRVDGVIARRQAGSTLKPFLYGLAIEKRLLTAASMLDDSPLHIPTGRGLYVPHDYDHRSRGPVSVRTALSSSLNIPAVRTQLLVGTESFADRLRKAGFGLDRSADFYGFSLALGTADVTLKELVNAYRMLATGGMTNGLRLTPGHGARQARVMDRRAAHIITDILADRSSRSITFGMDNPLTTRYWSAVKTGTSKDMRDNWCIGFSRDYTVGVWVGNFSGEPMWNVSGISGAAPVWLEVMNYLQRNRRSVTPRLPDGIVRAGAVFPNGTEPEREELFLAGTEPPPPPTTVEEGDSRLVPKIAYPPSGTIIVIDPDIPHDNQKVFFQADNANVADLFWRLNNELLPQGEDGRRWAPRPGRFVLALVDGSGKTLDTVTFTVRGTSSMGGVENGGLSATDSEDIKARPVLP